MTHNPLHIAYQSFSTGEIDRRGFVQRALALGLAPAMVAMLADRAEAQDASPEASPVSEVTGADRPQAGTEGQERGAGGELRLIQWQAATQLSPHVSTGVKDLLAGQIVMEPLIHYLTDARMMPNLITRVPSQANGLLNEDLTEVTFELLPDLLWNDGTPVTAEDIKFTCEWVLNQDNGATTYAQFEPIDHVEDVDELTAKVVFKSSNPFWMTPFAGTTTGFLYPKHALEAEGSHEAFLANPVGTGPFKVENFVANDEVRYVINEHYREPNKPYFSSIYLKGGGDPAAAARAVLQTGEYDYAWYLQAEMSVLQGMETEEGPGKLIPFPAATVERLNFQFADPNTEVDGQRAEMNTPNPRMADPAVREAIALAIDRQLILDEFYGDDMSVATNIVQGDPRTYSENTTFTYDPDQAKQVLEDAGWVMDGDVRAKDGVQLSLTYATEVNALSQKTQTVIKSQLEEVGFKVAIESIDPGMFYDGSAGNDQNLNHFYWDMNMYKSVPSSPRPLSFMAVWYSGENLENIAQQSNGWSGRNNQRYISEEYDALYEASTTETDAENLADLFIAMNDHLVNNHVLVPLIVVGTPRGMSKRLREENVSLGPFSFDYWNIANWNFSESE